MNVGNLQAFLQSLAELLHAHQGKKVAGEFDAFCGGLGAFQDFPVSAFATFLREAAEEYKRTGTVVLPQGKAAKKAAGRKKLKPKDDAEGVAEGVAEAVTRLRALYERATDTALTYAAIDEEVGRIAEDFDRGGLVAAARGFGVSSGLSSKGAAAELIGARIKERKGSPRAERGDRRGPVDAGGGPSHLRRVALPAQKPDDGAYCRQSHRSRSSISRTARW